MKFDKRDKEILSVLGQNARASVSEIARKTGIPRDSVHYRVQGYFKKGLIKKSITVLDPKKLGFPVYVFVFVTFQNCSEKEETQFYSHLMEHIFVNYVCKISGKLDCCFGITAKDIDQYDEILRGIRRKFAHIIRDVETGLIVDEMKYDDMSGVVGE